MPNLILMPGETEPAPVVTGRVSITRSFSFKMNMGNYESRDFFCSQNAECEAARAEQVSDAVYQFCKRQVLAAVAEYKAELAASAAVDRHVVNERKAELQRSRLQSVTRAAGE